MQWIIKSTIEVKIFREGIQSKLHVYNLKGKEFVRKETGGLSNYWDSRSSLVRLMAIKCYFHTAVL